MTFLFKKHIKAFTLMEVLVAISIFVVAIVAVNKIYLNISKSRINNVSTGLVYSDLEYFLQLASNNIKQAQFDYSNLCGVLSGRFFDQEMLSDIGFYSNDKCWYFYLDSDQIWNTVVYFDPLDIDTYYEYEYPITSNNSRIKDLQFLVEDDISTGMPIVTILVKASPPDDQDNEIVLQNSVSVSSY